MECPDISIVKVMMMHAEKLCKRCGEIKTTKDFGKDQSRADGFDFYCLECRRKGAIKKKSPPSFRRCTRCKKTKPIRKFGKSIRRCDGKETVCSSCKFQAYVKPNESYQRNKAKTSLYNREYRRTAKEWAFSVLGGACCDCGLKPSKDWPLHCFDFHHEDGSKKEGHIARLLEGKRHREALEAEIKKCVILCANCHRRRHAFEGSDR